MNIYTGMVVYRFKGVIKGTFVTRVCNVYSSEYCREFFVHTVGKYEIPIPITCQYIISHTKPNSLVMKLGQKSGRTPVAHCEFAGEGIKFD